MKLISKIAFFAIAFFATQTLFAQDRAMTESSTLMDKDEVTVIHLTQTPGQFDTQTLNLKPGKYIFKVTNENVDHEVAFMLTPANDSKSPIQSAGLPNLLKEGQTAQSNVVNLTAGTYNYSCPLNPTPQYTLTVQ